MSSFIDLENGQDAIRTGAIIHHTLEKLGALATAGMNDDKIFLATSLLRSFANTTDRGQYGKKDNPSHVNQEGNIIDFDGLQVSQMGILPKGGCHLNVPRTCRTCARACAGSQTTGVFIIASGYLTPRLG